MDVELKAFLQRAESVLARVEPLLPSQPPVINWDRTFAARWQRDARSGFLAPLEVSLDLSLADLIGIDRQRDLLSANTRQFVDGLPANHVLLWGARGTGKSSLIRALLAEYAADGLRLIDGELHPNEAVEDKIALSDRFGLWLSFYPFTQQHYLSVVRHWIDSLARQASLEWAWNEDLEKDAIRWATGRGNRNGRCAYQYARQWVGKRLLEARG